MASIAYDSDGCHHIEKIDNIVTVFACGHRKPLKRAKWCGETSWIAMSHPPYMLSHIRHEKSKATFNATGFEHACGERAHVLRSINVYLILC